MLWLLPQTAYVLREELRHSRWFLRLVEVQMEVVASRQVFQAPFQLTPHGGFVQVPLCARALESVSLVV